MNFPYQIVDLTHSIDENTPSWGGACGFHSEIELDYSDCSAGTQFRVQQFKIDAGIGTHIDAPAHCIAGSTTIDQLALSELIVPCVVINICELAHERYSLLPGDIEKFEYTYGAIAQGSFVMIHTGWERFWNNPQKYRNNYLFPSVSSDAAKILIAKNVCGIGIDTLSPDRPADGYHVHQSFLGNGKYIIENVANLGKLPAQGSMILAIPIKIKGATEAPIRLIGLINTYTDLSRMS